MPHCGLTDIEKARRLQRSTPNECTIDIRHPKKRLCIVGFNRSAIKNPNQRRWPTSLIEPIPNKGVDLLRIIGASALAGTNSPNRLVGNHNPCRPFSAGIRISNTRLMVHYRRVHALLCVEVLCCALPKHRLMSGRGPKIKQKLNLFFDDPPGKPLAAFLLRFANA
jgi:hypothetical protein